MFINSESKRRLQLTRLRTRYATTSSASAGAGDDFDPYLFRDDEGTNFAQTLAITITAMAGTGLLVLPAAFEISGVVVGMVCLLLIGILGNYGLHLLFNVIYELCQYLRVPYLNYPDAMEAALLLGPRMFRKYATTSRIIVDTVLVVHQIGLCSTYIVFVTYNLKAVLVPYIQRQYSIQIYILMLVIPFLIITIAPNNKSYLYLSLIFDVLLTAGLAIIFYIIFYEEPDMEDSKEFGDVVTYPVLSGVLCFSLIPVGTVVAIEKRMETPSDFIQGCGVLNISAIIVIVISILMGTFGYLRYANDGLCSSVTLNLDPALPSTVASRVLLIIAVSLSYSINAYSPVDIIWSNYISKRYNEDGADDVAMRWDYVLRLLVVISTFTLALTIPLLLGLTTFFGAFGVSLLVFIFPPFMQICLKWPFEFGFLRWILIKDIILIAFGMFNFITGTLAGIRFTTQNVHSDYLINRLDCYFLFYLH